MSATSSRSWDCRRRTTRTDAYWRFSRTCAPRREGQRPAGTHTWIPKVAGGIVGSADAVPGAGVVGRMGVGLGGATVGSTKTGLPLAVNASGATVKPSVILL